MSEQKRQYIGFDVDPDLRQQIEQAAARERRKVASFVRNVMCEYLEATGSGKQERAA